MLTSATSKTAVALALLRTVYGETYSAHVGKPEVDQEKSTKMIAWIEWQFFFDRWASGVTVNQPGVYDSKLHACWFEWKTEAWASTYNDDRYALYAV